MATIETILSMIDKYGTALVILISFLLWAKPWADKIMANLLEVKKIIPVAHKEDIELIIQLNTKINLLLKELKVDMGSDWAQFWQFHNGTRSVGKVPFMYLSLTHEQRNPENAEMQVDFEQLPMSMFDTFARAVTKTDVVVHPMSATEPGDTVSRMGEIMSNQFGVVVSVMRAVRDVDGLVIGFISASWDENVDIDDNKKDLIRRYSARMSAIIASYEVMEKKSDKVME